MGGPVEPLAALRRWEDSGAVWRVLSRAEGTVTLALCTCDGGEEMSRIVSDDPDLLAHVGDRRSSEDGD